MYSHNYNKRKATMIDKTMVRANREEEIVEAGDAAAGGFVTEEAGTQPGLTLP